jgi:hypothetical protein
MLFSVAPHAHSQAAKPQLHQSLDERIGAEI